MIERSRRIRMVVGVGLLVALPGPAFVSAQDAPSAREVEVRLEPSLDVFPNPERGFYSPRMSNRLDGLDRLRARSISLVLVELDLRDFKDRAIGPEKLDELRRAFAAVRTHGLKMIFRAAYGFTGRDYRADPKDLGRIVGHIRQLGAVFADNRDVLWGVQAGFLGPWGEWHGSNWGDPPSLEARRTVLFALLDAAPSPIPVHVRRPMFIRDLFAGEPGGSDLTAATAFGGSRLSRTGWHDDALLSLPTDMGTFAERGWDRARELAWCARHGRFTPFGGETVPPSARTPIPQVVRELEQLHATYLNSAYHGGTLRRWREADYRGENAFAHIERRLGYRLVAERLRYTPRVTPGGTFRMALELKNLGFASPQLPRDVSVLLCRDDRVLSTRLEQADPRRWGPEAGVVRIDAEMKIPADAPRGTWQVALLLADPSPALGGDGRYAIRLANRDVRFLEKTGANVLADDLEVR